MSTLVHPQDNFHYLRSEQTHISSSVTPLVCGVGGRRRGAAVSVEDFSSDPSRRVSRAMSSGRLRPGDRLFQLRLHTGALVGSEASRRQVLTRVRKTRMQRAPYTYFHSHAASYLTDCAAGDPSLQGI